jgi:hypothetical protein
MYRPDIRNLTVKKRFQIGPYSASIVTDVQSIGSVQYLYLLFLYSDSDLPIYYVSSEINEMGTGGSHFLCAFEQEGHVNYGSSDKWADYHEFVTQAIKLVGQKYGIPESELPEV